MPEPDRRRRPPSRADLPAELTADTLRHVGLRTLRRFADPRNGVLDPAEQQRFDAALVELRQDVASLADLSRQRARRGEPVALDPAMRRSYQRAQRRLADQAERARRGIPDLPVGIGSEPLGSPEPPGSTDEEAPSDPGVTSDEDADDDVSPDSLEQEVEQTSDTLDMLEQIASLQRQLLEHQRGQVLAETRGLFFGFLVSVAVIVAGVAPLVEADPHDRVDIVVWTVVATAAAAVVYAAVRRVQARAASPAEDSKGSDEQT